MPKTPTFWGNLIRELRREHGVSQRELVAVTGINRSTLRRMEDGTGVCQLDILSSILQEFDFVLVATGNGRVIAEGAPVTRSQLAARRLLTMPCN